MIYLEIFAVGLIVGFIGGMLFFRNNVRKFQDSEVKAKDVYDAFKK